MKLILKPSTRKNKKWMVIFPDNKKTVHFGARGMSDFTIHKNPQRKELYIGRHKKKESKFWTHKKANLLRPSYWSRYLLWEKPSLSEGIKFIERKNVKLILNLYKK